LWGYDESRIAAELLDSHNFTYVLYAQRNSVRSARPSEITTKSEPVVAAEVVLASRDPYEVAVQQCIGTKELQAVYLKFTVEEFTTGM
jgi:hypothetical protein